MAPAWPCVELDPPMRSASGPVATPIAKARDEARACGVTRLADITGLDVLGAHVFQAVRPWGRSLSVHQGKALTAEGARIGALMEAIECHHAEGWRGEQRRLAVDRIDPLERAPTLLDFAADRRRPPDPSEPISWVAARSPQGGRRLWVPFDAVSMDLTRAADARLDRSSNGLGARFDHEGAALKALMEVVERDAEWAWRASSLADRSRAEVEPESIRHGWFSALLARARDHGLVFSLYHLPVVIPLNAFYCEILEPTAGGAARRCAGGTGCGFTAEEALMAAVLEAAQSRLTAISGARDDICARDPSTCPGLGPALPPGGGRRLQTWDALAAPLRGAPAATVGGVADALARAGYPDIGLVDLSHPDRDVHVVRAFVPGLGAFSRARRPPAARPIRRAA